MSADVLRRAAALMRERAEAATDGVCPQWTHNAVRHIARNCDIECWHEDDDPRVEKYHGENDVSGWDRYADAAHIASWHPAVALAVADWLDEAADHLDVFEDDDLHPDLREHVCPTALEGPECSVLGQALAVARAYIGEQP